MDFFSQPIQMENLPLLWVLKILTAIVCGAMIGVEREIQRKSAGLRTNILICVGATIYMLSSELIMTALGAETVDPTRIAAQIVTGMGFIGAGSIIQSRGTISGLTTAATLWVVAAIGISVGVGYLPFSIFISLVILAVLVGVAKVEYMILGKCRFTDVRISYHDTTGETRSAISDILNSYNKKIEDFHVSSHRTKTGGDVFFMELEFCEVHPRHKEFLFEILRLPDVRTTSYNPALVETNNLTPSK
jgi:putative Mg2+ transporter-C (MgtC) family protein